MFQTNVHVDFNFTVSRSDKQLPLWYSDLS